MKLITDNVPGAVKEQDMKALFGRKVAIDASMSLYQFLVEKRFFWFGCTRLILCQIAVRAGPDESMLTNEFGEVTR